MKYWAIPKTKIISRVLTIEVNDGYGRVILKKRTRKGIWRARKRRRISNMASRKSWNFSFLVIEIQYTFTAKSKNKKPKIINESPTSVLEDAIFKYCGLYINTIAMPIASMIAQAMTSGNTLFKNGFSLAGKILPEGRSAQYAMRIPEKPTVK